MNNVHELLLTALCVEAVCVEEPLQGCRAAGLGGVSLWLCRGEGTEFTDTVIDYLYLLHMEQMSVTLHVHTAG